MADEKSVGKITHYYDKIGVAIIDLTAPLKLNQTIHIKGPHSDFNQPVTQLQCDHKDIQEGKPGEQVGIKVEQKTHENDEVFVIE